MKKVGQGKNPVCPSIEATVPEGEKRASNRNAMTIKLRYSAAYLLCAILVWRYSAPLDGVEFVGGQLTGPLLKMADLGIVLFALAMILAFFKVRISAATGLIASLMSLPLYLYFTFPSIFGRVFKGESSVPATADFLWGRAIIEATSLILTAIYSFRRLRTSRVPQ